MKRLFGVIAVFLFLSGGVFADLSLAEPVRRPPVLLAQATRENTVVFNTSSLKFHGAGCTWAHKCTRNCITLSHAEAVKRGGVPCKVCGGR